MARQHIIGGVIVKERHPFAPLGLSIITLGIYFFVWWYLINDETRRLGEKVSPGISVLALFPGVVLIVPPFVTIWTTADRIARLQERARVANPISPIVALILTIIPIVNLFAWAYLQGGLNRAYELIATHGQAPGGYAQAPPAGYYPPPPYQQPYPQQPYPPQGYQQPYPQQPYPPQGYQQPYPQQPYPPQPYRPDEPRPQ